MSMLYLQEIAHAIKHTLTRKPFEFNVGVKAEMLSLGVIDFTFTDRDGQGYHVTIQDAVQRKAQEEGVQDDAE